MAVTETTTSGLLTAEPGADDRPFTFEAIEADLEDLREPIKAQERHFAAWEEPELFSQEIRAAFTSLRDQRRSS